MPTFQYRAVTSNGHVVEERIETNTQVNAMIEIEKKGLQLIEIKQVNQFKMLITSKRVSKKELSMFCKQLSYLVNTGVSLHRGVEIIGEQTKNAFFKSVIQRIIQDIKQGVPISHAISVHPNVFPESMVFQMKAAEAGGFMPEALLNLSSSFARDADFSSKVRGAMVYPASILVVALGIVYFMLAVIVPSMSKTLTGFNAELPPLTMGILTLSNFVKSYWYVGLMIIGTLIYLLYMTFQDEKKRLILDGILIKIPILGHLIISINVARMTRIMASLLSSGVPIDDTLDNLKNVLSNLVMKEQIKKVKEEVVDQGVSLSKSLEMKPIFPRTMVQVVAVGEEAGSLPEVLTNLAENLEEDVTGMLKSVTSLINPILTILIGVIVAVIVLSLFLPMFSLMDQF